VQPGSGLVPTTHGTFGRTSEMELPLCDPGDASLRTSKATYRLDSPQSSATWKSLVTQRRVEYSARLKSAHRTRGNGYSSWRTPTEAETHNQDYSSQTYLQNQVQPNWPTVCASEDKANRYRDGVAKGTQIWLTTAVIKHGQAAPASSSTDGSRQESWLTPRANEPEGDPNFVARNADRGEHCHGSLGSQVKSWATPIMGDSHLASTPEVAQKRIEEGKVTLSRQMAAQWATPRANKVHPEITEDNRDHLANRNKSNLEEEIAGHCGKATGKLNPRWVETLMGLPIGWTMPSCTRPVTIEPTNCDCLETESCLQQQSEHLEH
jgi:hypothetical protein